MSEPTKRRATGYGTTLRVEVGRRTAWLHGPHMVPLLNRAHITARAWDPARRCWSVSVASADDVIAAAEHWQRRVVTVEEVTR